MKKIEVKNLNKVKRIRMEDIRELAKSKEYRLGYKCGFNTARRQTRRALGLLPKTDLTKEKNQVMIKLEV